MSNKPEKIELQTDQTVYTTIDNEVVSVRVDQVYQDYCVVETEERSYCRYKKDLYFTPEEVSQQTTRN
jgi:hypothetical protein